MSHCHAEGNQHPTGSIDMYVGMLNSKFYSSNGGNSELNVDRFQSWSRYNAASFSPPANSESTWKERNLDEMGPSCKKSGNFSKTDGSYGNAGGEYKTGESHTNGIDQLSQKGVNYNKGLVVGTGKAGASCNGPLSRNSDNGVLPFSVLSPISNSRTVKETLDLSGGKIGSPSNGELPKVPTRFDSVVGVKRSAAKVGENNAFSSSGVISHKDGLDSLNFSIRSLKVGCEELSSSGASSNGGGSSPDSVIGGASSTRNSGSKGLCIGGSAVKSIGTLGNILGRGGSGPQVSITGNVGNPTPLYNKTSTNNGQPSIPVTCRGTSINKNCTQFTSDPNGTLGCASAPKASSDCSVAGGISHRSNVPGGSKSVISPAKGNSASPNITDVGNLRRTNYGNVLNGSGNNSCTVRATGKVDASMGNVLRAGGLSNASIGKADRKMDSFKNAADSSGTGNVHFTMESAWLKRALSSADAEEVKTVGNQLYTRGQFREALSLYDRAILLSPGQASYHSNRAAALTGLGRLAEAVQECEEAIQIDPLYGRAHQRVACLYIRLGSVENAKRHLTASEQQADWGDMRRAQNIEKHISRCIEARKAGDWKVVIRESDAAVVAGADSAPRVFGYKAEALLKLGRPEEADPVLSAAQKVESSLMKSQVVPTDSFLFLIRGQIDMALGRFESAIMAAESAVRIDPHNAEASALMRKSCAIGHARTAGNELFRAGKFFEACASYGEGLESDPKNAVLLCNRAACRSKLGQWEKAVEDCNAALNVQPNYTKALMRRANCNAKLERWEDALRDFEILRREVPGDMEVARGIFDVQVAIKKSRGEEIYKMKFGGEVEEVSSNEQFREAVTSPGLAVVEFNTRWSDRCRQISPFIDQLCKCHPSVNFLKVDVDDNPYLAKTESVSFVPTFKIYKNGLKVKEILGPSQQALEFAVKHYSL